MLIICWLKHAITFINKCKIHSLVICIALILSSHSNAIKFSIKHQYSDIDIGVYDSKTKNWIYADNSDDSINDILISAPMVIEKVLEKIGNLDNFIERFQDIPDVYPIHHTELQCADEHGVEYAAAITVLEITPIGDENTVNFCISVQSDGCGNNEEAYIIHASHSFPGIPDTTPSSPDISEPEDLKKAAVFENEPISSRTRSKKDSRTLDFFELPPHTKRCKTRKPKVRKSNSTDNTAGQPYIPKMVSGIGSSSNPVQENVTNTKKNLERSFPHGMKIKQEL